MSLPLIDRYIATSVFAAIAAVLLCALSLTGVFALIDEAGGIDQNYTFTDAALYVLYNLPNQIYESVPFVGRDRSRFTSADIRHIGKWTR